MPADPLPDHFLGLDLGQASDYTALAVLERRWVREGEADASSLVAHHALRHLQRWPLGTPYTTIVSEVTQLVQKPPLSYPNLAIDQTGVGRAVVNMFAEAQPAAVLRPVLITAGHQITRGDDGAIHVPKKELASVLQALLQTRRLKIANLPEREVLVKELLAFRVKITLSANETFEAWRERDHDDLVLSVAMGAWMAERHGGAFVPPARVETPSPRDRLDPRRNKSHAAERGLFGAGQ
jgi:hypothetical protein